MIKNRISLGIDIADDRISFALVKQSKDGLHLLKAADTTVPEGAITNGNIANPALIAGQIKNLLKKNGIRTRQAVVSLVANPVIAQIINLPEEMPGNIGQFIQSEIKHSPVLAGREPYYDYCGLNSTGLNGAERIFVAATEAEKIYALMKTLAQANVEPSTIELGIFAAMRALYKQKIAENYDCNTLIAFVHSSVLTICVFRKNELDFIRSINIADQEDSDMLLALCEREIDAVMQFYDIEVDIAPDDKWQIIAITESSLVSANELEFVLQKKFGMDACICSPDNIYQSTDIIESQDIEKASITAAGLAMKKLDVSQQEVKVDLIPPEAEEIKATKKLILATANIVAIILLAMFIVAGVVKHKLSEADQVMQKKRLSEGSDNIEQLLQRQGTMNTKFAYLNEQRAKIGDSFKGNNVRYWAEILDDVRQRIPRTLYITRLACFDNKKIVMEGNAISFKSIHVFAEMLGKSKFIESAAVSGTNKNSAIDGLVAYSINCVLDNSDKQENQPDAN